MYDEGGPRSMTATSKKGVTIKGGANVKDRFSLATPTGMVTEVTDEELAFLQANPHFQRHVKAGFMKVMKQEKLSTKDMAEKDASAQITDAEHASRSETTASAGLHDRFKGLRGAGFVA